ncbi:spermatogenesis-associated protein 1 isoform X2 [Lampetra planeri]
MESTRSRPPSSQLVYVHVWLLPQPLWKEETNTALAQDTTRAVSVGFVRTLPDWPLLVVRRQVERELDRDVTQQFIFLKGMGPHLVHVNVKQEQHVKVKSIFYSLVPDEPPPRPEVIFILPGSALRSPSRPLSLPWGSRQTGRWDVSTPPSREPDNLVSGVGGGGAGAAVPNNRTPPPPPLTPPSPAMPPPLLTPRLELPAPSRHQEAARGGGKTAPGNGADGRTAAGRRGGGGNLAPAAVGVPTTPATSATLDSGIGGGSGGLALSVSSRSGDAQTSGKRAVEDAVTFAPTAPTAATTAAATAATSHRVRGRTSGDEDSDSDDVTSSDSMVLPPPPALRITIAAPAATAEPPPSVTPRRPEVTAPAGTRAKVATPPSPRRANGGGGGGGGEESAPDDGFPVAPPPPPAFVAGGGRDAGENGGKDAGRYSNKDGGKDGGAQGGGGCHADFTQGAERRGLAGEHGAAGEGADEGRVRQPATEPEPELAAKELSELQGERREMERHRRELVARIKETRVAMHARRAEAREAWKRRYLHEKRATPALEEELRPVREELDALLSRNAHLTATATTTTLKDTLLARLQGAQRRVEKLVGDIESGAAKLRSEQKLRKDAQQELKAARAQLAQRRALASVARKPGVAYGL